MNNIIVIGQSVQGLLAAALLSKNGNKVQMVHFCDEQDTHDLTHIPFALPKQIIDELNLVSYGFELPDIAIENPFQKLPLYDGLKKIVEMVSSLDNVRPPYKEKSWRDAWGTFELGRVLSDYGDDIQQLFAKSFRLSLVDLLQTMDLSAELEAQIIALCTVGAKTDPSTQGSAASILPAMANYEHEDCVLLSGCLYHLIHALEQVSIANGAEKISQAAVKKFVMNGNDIQSIILEDSSQLSADYYIIDYDPVRLFQKYLDDYAMFPAFRNRVTPSQNLKECVRIRAIVNGENIENGIIAPSVEYLTRARAEMKTEGGAQNPMLSLINCKNSNESGHNIDIIAQYFDSEVAQDNNNAIVEAVKKTLLQAYPNIQIIEASVGFQPSQFGQPSFVGTMPLLQLFKVFSGHHSIAYDMPIDNLVMVGYGQGTCAHYHVNDAGIRTANILQNL